MIVTVGASTTASFTVTEADTAIALGSGDVPVLATPRMIRVVRGGHRDGRGRSAG